MSQTLEFIDRIVANGWTDASLMAAKRALIETYGVQDGFAIFRQKMTHLSEQGEIHQKRLASLQEIAPRRAHFYAQTAGREPVLVAVPRTIGAGNHYPLLTRSRSLFVACLGEARVRARSNLIEFGDLMLADREGEEWSCYEEQYDFDASVFQASGDRAWVITPEGDEASLELDEAFSLLGVRPQVFGHWMCEYLPRYVAASLSGVLPAVPVLVEAGMPQSHYDALRLVLAEPVEIIELAPYATARVRRLWCAPSLALFAVAGIENERSRLDDNVLPPARYGPIVQEMARRAEPELSEPTRIDRVFLARKPGLGHAMVNAAAIQAAAERRGFRVIFPEELEFREQARLVRHARFVAGSAGSAMWLGFFAQPGTKLCLLTVEWDAVFTQQQFTGVFEALGLDVTMITGPWLQPRAEDTHLADFTIDEAGFGYFLDQWLAPPQPGVDAAASLADTAARRVFDNQERLLATKRWLVAEFGVAEGFARYRDLHELPDQAEIHPKRLASLQEIASREAIFYARTAEREPVLVPVPRMIGAGDHYPLLTRSRSLFVACLGDARVRARSNLIEFGDLALADREGEEWSCYDEQYDFDASVFKSSGEAAWMITPPGASATVELEEAFSLLGLRPQVFGHWMCEYLPRYVAASLSGVLPAVPVLVEAGMPKSHSDALRLVLAEPVEIIELAPYATARVRRLWCAPSLALFAGAGIANERSRLDDNVLPPARYGPIVQEMARRAEPELADPTGIDRVFLARQAGGEHAMVNAAAIHAAAEQRGFRVIFPEELEFREQARLVRHARFVAGPAGSAMFLGYFAKPGTKLCMLTGEWDAVFTQQKFTGVFEALGLEVTVITGPWVKPRVEDAQLADFTIDEAGFGHFLDQWLAPPQPGVDPAASLAGTAARPVFDNQKRLLATKRWLVREFPIPQGFALYRQLLDHPQHAEIRYKKLGWLQEVAQQRGLAYQPTAVAEPFVVPVPRVIGDGNHRPLQGHSRSMFVACLSDARVRARSNVIEVDDLAVLDRTPEEMALFDDRLDFDPSVFAVTDDAAWIITPKDDTASVEIDEAFTLLGIRPHIFGHWMCEHLSRYLAAVLTGALPPVPVLVEAGMPAAHYEALRLMLAEGVEIVELSPFATARVRRLWCAPSQALFPVYEIQNDRFKWDDVALPPARYAPIVREMARRANRGSAGTIGAERIFLARKPGLNHAMVNSAAIQAAAEKRGFRLVFPEDLAFAEQVSLLRQARVVLGEAGSAMFLAYFAQPGTKLCMLAYAGDVLAAQCDHGVLGAIGIDVTIFTGPAVRVRPEDPSSSDFEIDEAAFCRFLDGWLKPPFPLVSIVYVTYRHEKFALDALRSVLGQTYPMLDIIILDDASPDGTADIIAAELAKHRDRIDIRFIRNDENLGRIANQHKGVSLTQGDFIVMFAGDDIMLPATVEKMVEVWREADVSLVTANVRYIDETGQELNRLFCDPAGPYDETFETLARNCGNAVSFGAAMGFERSLYEEFGWPPEYLTSEDVMIAFYAYLAKGARFIPEPLLKYRVHKQNASMTLQYERSTNPVDKLRIWAEDRYIHISHAVLMISELDRLAQLDPARYRDVEQRIRPLLNALLFERAQQMVEARIKLNAMGVTSLAAVEATAAPADKGGEFASGKLPVEFPPLANSDNAGAPDFIDQAVVNRDLDCLLMFAKRSVIEKFGLRDGFAVYSQKMTHLPDQGEIHLKQLVGLREVSQRRAEVFLETLGREPFTVPVPTVIGEGEHRPLHGRSRSMFVACLTNARVRARSNVIEVDDLALVDREHEEFTCFDDQLDLDASVFQATEEGAWIITPKGEAATIELDEAFTLLGVRPQVFGHWLCEYLPKYVAASLTGGLPSVPVLVEADMPKTHYEALELMLAKPVEIIRLPPFATARVRRLWCAPAQALFPVYEVQNERFKWDYFSLPPARYAPIVREMARRADRASADATGVDRVFLARKASLDHAMVDSDAIEAAAVKRGFRLVYPEELTFRDQVCVLRSARFVVGQAGAAMFLAYFARPGTKLCVLSYAGDVASAQCDMSGVLSAIGLDVTIYAGALVRFRADNPYRSDFEIDEGAFSRFLDDWLQSPSCFTSDPLPDEVHDTAAASPLRRVEIEPNTPAPYSPATISHDLEYIEDTSAHDAWCETINTRTLKQSLVVEFDVWEGFARYRQLNDQPGHDEIHHKRLGSLKEIAERRNGVFCEMAPGNEPLVVPPPVVIGEGAIGPLAARARSMFVACLNDARVRAGSNIIEVDNLVLLDYQEDELARIDDRIDLDPAIFCATNEAAWIITPKGAAASVEIEEAFTLLGFRPRAFGHWMLEYLPKYIGASLSGALPRVPVLIEAGLPKAHRQALRLLLPEDIEIIELPRLATARVRRLWCASNLAYFPIFEEYNERFKWEYFVMPPARYAPISREMARRVDRLCADPTGVDRVFLARELSNHHHAMVNQTAIEAIAQARGFLIVYPNRLDFIEQVRLVRHARFVMGPSGGGMYLNFFARPGTKLCMFRYVDDVIAAQCDMTGLFSAIGLDVTVLTGGCARLDPEFPPGSDFEIDESAFCRFLDRWLQS